MNGNSDRCRVVLKNAVSSSITNNCLWNALFRSHEVTKNAVGQLPYLCITTCSACQNLALQLNTKVFDRKVQVAVNCTLVSMVWILFIVVGKSDGQMSDY